SADDLVGLVLKCGETSVTTLALLDEANTSTYGVPEITEVFTGLHPAPGILVSGHDLKDLEEILEQTKDKGIKIYTHGEMLPCNAYPGIKKYDHLAGNFGAAWYQQDKEFVEFAGPIVMTTNCLVKPKDSYKDRVFTTGLVGWPGLKHIDKGANGDAKDFSPVIEKALQCGNLQQRDGKKLTIGFNHRTVLGLADKIVGAVKDGAIKRF
ncbi:MAG: hydroxylamine reductase, partial [Planctomycetes bacterium]|nr:hydroxylamine reductase [Planctomycetota bacterium]